MTHWDESTDFLIIGSGGGSMCAALVMAKAGKHPLILEKQAKVGGSTCMSGGVIWIPNHPLQAAAGVKDSFEDSRLYMDSLIGDAGPASSSQRRDVYVETGPQCIQFLMDMGMCFARSTDYSDYFDDLPGGKPEGRSLIGKMFNGRELGPWYDKLQLVPPLVPINTPEFRHLLLAGRSLKGLRAALTIVGRFIYQKMTGNILLGLGGAIQGRMLQIALRNKIAFQLETKVTELIIVDGRVAGVVAEYQGKTKRIHARDGVLINAGGFAHNLQMRETYGPHPASTAWTMSNPGDTGEVLNEAIRLGAATDLTDQAVWVPISTPPGSPPIFHVQDMSKPGSILVDATGQRFVNESISYMELGQAIYKRNLEAKAIPAWYIRDSRSFKRYPLGGMFALMQPKSWLKSGYLKKANTLAELAELCGIDPVGLQTTVTRFNQAAQIGKDVDFKRGERAYDRYFGDPSVTPNPTLMALETPPFYAVALYPGDVGTCGGLLTDASARVLHKDGQPIEGLYATGNSTASVMGRSYPGAGASIGNSFVWAYVAAQHALSTQSRSCSPISET